MELAGLSFLLPVSAANLVRKIFNLGILALIQTYTAISLTIYMDTLYKYQPIHRGSVVVRGRNRQTRRLEQPSREHVVGKKTKASKCSKSSSSHDCNPKESHSSSSKSKSSRSSEGISAPYVDVTVKDDDEYIPSAPSMMPTALFAPTILPSAVGKFESSGIPSSAPSIESNSVPSLPPTITEDGGGSSVPSLTPTIHEKAATSFASTVPITSNQPTLVPSQFDLRSSFSPSAAPSFEASRMPSDAPTSAGGSTSAPTGSYSTDISSQKSGESIASSNLKFCQCNQENVCINRTVAQGVNLLRLCFFASDHETIVTIDNLKLVQTDLHSVEILVDDVEVHNSVMRTCDVTRQVCAVATSIDSEFFGIENQTNLIAEGTVVSRLRSANRNLRSLVSQKVETASVTSPFIAKIELAKTTSPMSEGSHVDHFQKLRLTLGLSILAISTALIMLYAYWDQILMAYWKRLLGPKEGLPEIER